MGFAKGAQARFVGWMMLALLFGGVSSAKEPAQPPAEPPLRRMSSVTLPQVDGTRVRREFESEDHVVSLDLTEQNFRVTIPPDESTRALGDYRVGDTVRVLHPLALKVKDKVVARLPAGKLICVTKVQDKWLEAYTPTNSGPTRGWALASEVELISDEPIPQPTLSGIGANGFASAAALLQKAKQFDDGLYAAVEIAAEIGAGDFLGKSEWLRRLANALAEGKSEPEVNLRAACKLAGITYDSPGGADPAADRLVKSFMGTPTLSKPVGFYTWSGQLEAIFRQDRVLQTPWTDPVGVERVVSALSADDQAARAYETYLRLISRLTNPLVAHDLRESLAEARKGNPSSIDAPVGFFPPSVAHETELVKRLFADKPIPDDFELFQALIDRVRSGEIDLKPTENSGWYDYQTWSLEPLAMPERTPEGAKLELNDEYRAHLLELFKGSWALARETHVKQLEFPPESAAGARDEPPPKPKIHVSPELSAEPIPTAYFRRAAGYRFVRQVLEETFGAEALAGMRRQTADGPVTRSLADELSFMIELFEGAARVTQTQLGLVPKGDDSSSATTFLDWSANLDLDPDLATDARMMVPVFFDLQRMKTKAWVFLGWSTQAAYFGFSSQPSVVVRDAAGVELASDAYELFVDPTYQSLATPVVREIYVDRLLDRKEFRRHCDAYRSTRAILENLE